MGKGSDENNCCVVINSIGFVLLRTNSWGYLRNGTSFDGIVGALHRKETDIGSSAFFRKDRFAFVDYPAETWGSRY
ncbi:unnamed protein product [Leptidea sinapis]|uniref:Uncharacterized protein n=1 Tax=Leptidea sinapis TaxID=189913 RepID=A0A5E4R2N0_9NEOP|nr:unnamed protein product [Leptidea sinapis]